MSEGRLANTIERFADKNPEVSLREFLTKVYIRPRMFWSCVIIPSLLAVLLMALIPPSWEATAQILIRYSSDESTFLSGLIPADRKLLSGQTSAEILKSIPTLAKTITQQHITADDIYQSPTDVLSGYVSGFVGNFFSTSLPPGLPGIDPKTLILAKMFQKSLEKSSSSAISMFSKKDKVQVLETTENIPATMKGDELITVTVPSFNRDKVAQMANGLAQAFIEEYYRISAADAKQSYDFLSKLVAQADENVQALEQGKKPVLDPATSPDATDSTDIARQNPLLENLSKQLAATDADLAHSMQIYQPSSVEVERLTGEAQYLQNTLSDQRRIAIARQALEELKVRRYQAYNTERMYENRLVPISIVEPAFTPKNSILKVAGRFVIAGAVGLVLGTILGLCLTVVFSATDQRIHTSWDTAKVFGLPLLGSLPNLLTPAKSAKRQHFETSPGLVNGLMQIIGHLDAADPSLPGQVVAISSSSDGEGKTFTALALANALAQNGRNRVLLIDANLADPRISTALKLGEAPGLVDAVLASTSFASKIVPAKDYAVDFLPAGGIARRGDLGIYSGFLRSELIELRSAYRFIIVDTPAILSGNEALACSLAADTTILVASAGTSRKPLIRAALQKMADVGVRASGVILNRQRQILPAFIYNNV